MSKENNKGRTNWNRMSPPVPAGEWLKALGIVAAMGLLACAAVFAMPAELEDGHALPVVINRVMTSNPAACFSVDGAYYDWIELKNISDETVHLAGWKLTDEADLREAFVFTRGTLDPGETKIVYCADAPEGYAGDEAFTGFSLSNDGELLLLADPHQHIAALDVPALGKKDVFQRDPDTGRYSGVPFYRILGDETDYATDLTPPFNAHSVIISEMMPVNRTVLMDADGAFSDWIELYNGSGEAVDLAGWALSDDDVNRQKWLFPERIMNPGEYLLVFASGKDRRDPSGELHANFKLSSHGERLRLYNPQGEVASWVEYEAAVTDKSLSRQADGSMTAHLEPSPGCPNTESGARIAGTAMRTNSLGLYINEIFSAGEGPDWVEIHNASDRQADLSGMGLSDNPAKPRKWQFPEGATLMADGYIVVSLAGPQPEDAMWEGDKAKAEKADLHPDYTAPFALSDAETVCLSTQTGALVDRVKLYDQYRDVSYGRAEGFDGFRYFADLTPGKPNAAKSYAGMTAEIQFSVPPGVVRTQDASLDLTSESGATIHYTTDGTEPTAESAIWSAPVTLKTNAFIKAFAVADDRIPTKVQTVTYILGPHTLPLVSVMGKAGQLNGENGVLNTGRKTEFQVYVEMYTPDGTKLVGQNCMFTLIGHHSRVNYGQKSFKLTAKRATGDTRFRAKLFSNRNYDEVKSVVLRAGGQDVEQTKMRDSILTALAADTSVMYQETEPCVVYVNGQYWGEYNLREHIDAHSIAQFEGWSDPDAVIIGEGGGESIGEYQALIRWVESHNLSRDANIEALRGMMDIENYLDYVILEMYANNQDLNNVRFYCSPDEDPRWKWVLFDLDLSFQLDRDNVSDWLAHSAGTITSQTTTPFRQLMSNDEMKDYFLTRFGQLLATTFTAENVTARIAARADLIRDEMALNCKRWGWKTATWDRYVNSITEYARKRPAMLIRDLCKTFKLSDSQREYYFGDALAKIDA